MADVVWSQTARRDLTAIADYIARDSAQNALRMIRRIRSAAESLETFPESGAIVAEHDRPDLREIYVASYRLIYHYEAAGDRVLMLTVIHGARRLPDIGAIEEADPPDEEQAT